MKGNQYSYEELIKVFSIYKRVSGSIHKGNPLIQSLAMELGRETRSVENQLLMFRAYERSKNGFEYGRKNFNKLVPEIFENNKSNNSDMEFPASFKKFRKSEKSSVSRISNVLLSSSPIDFISTPLNIFIDSLIQQENILKNKSIVALVGGAGNGKTESLGYILTKIKKHYKLFEDSEYLEECIQNSLNSNKGYFTSFEDRDFRLSFIQDATSVWSENGVFLTRPKSIEMAINQAFMDNKAGLLVVCVNRGVLSSLLRELHGFHKELFELIHDQVSQDGYIKETNNFAEPFREIYLVSSYPLDKMRLFDGGGVHSLFTNQMISKNWETEEYQSHFVNSQKVCGSLLDALELWNGGLLSFRDYLNYLYLFYAKIHDEDWLNIPLVKIWFATQFHTVSDVFDKVVSNSPEPLFGQSLSKLVDWRNRSEEILELDKFDPMKMTNLVSSDDVQSLLDNLSLPQMVVSFNSRGNVYYIYGYYKDLLNKLSKIDTWIDGKDRDSRDQDTPSDKYRVKRFLFNLTAQIMSFIICEKEELFFLSLEKTKFLNGSSEESIELLANALDLRKSSTSDFYVECVQSLADELWVHKENPSIKQRINLKIQIEELISTNKTKPKFPSRLFLFKNRDQGGFHLKVDFRQYYYLLLYKGKLQLYHENYSVSFSIWVNSLKEKLRSFAGKSTGYIEIFDKTINVNAEL